MGFTVHRLDSFTTNSVYLKVDCGVCHSIRVSDHRGKKHLKYRYNIGSYVRKFRSVHDMHRRYYFTVDEVDRLVNFVKYDRVHQIDVQHDLVRTLAVRYLELSERNIESRDDNGYGSMLAGYDFGRNEGVGKCQLHEAAKMLRREILNLDKMLGEQ